MNKTSITKLTIWRGILFLAAFVLIGCSSKKSDLGLSIQNSDGFVEGELIDTFSVFTWSNIDEDVYSTSSGGAGMIGEYTNDNIGTTKFSLTSQLIPIGTVDTISQTAVVDSVVISLFPYNQYGLSSSIDFEVLRVTEDLDENTEYYTDYLAATDGIDLVRSDVGPFYISSVDSVEVGGVLRGPQVRIQLENTFGDAIIAAANNGDLSSPITTKQWLKGLSIRPVNNSLSPNSGVVANVDTKSGASILTVYYTDDIGQGTLSLQYFSSNTSGSDDRITGYNNIINDPQNSLLGSITADTTLGNQTYIIHSGVASGKVKIPSLSFLKDSSYIVNKAELFIPSEYFIGDPFYYSSAMYLSYYDNTGTLLPIDDNRDLSQPSRVIIVGTPYNTVQKGYNMDCTLHCQRVVTGEITTNEMTLRNIRFFTGPEINVLSGPETPLKGQVYLKIYVTKY